MTAGSACATIVPVQGEVARCGKFESDEIDGFEKCGLMLPAEDDGELCATLIRRTCDDASSKAKPGVLYVHGFCDYFFQTHLADAFEDAGFRFYALDLRRYGRSICAGNRANVAMSVDDYFSEISWAIDCITEQQNHVSGIVAHSTGGLIACHYLNRGKRRDDLSWAILNNPFFRFNVSAADRAQLRLVSGVARWFPKIRLPQRLPPFYGKTLHRTESGSWDYDLTKKPLSGFPLYSGWFRMITSAQTLLSKLKLSQPVLCMCSAKGRKASKQLVAEDFSTDVVLDPEHTVAIAPTIGRHVDLLRIDGGVHDLTLSQPSVRQLVLSKMVEFAKIQESAGEEGVPEVRNA